MKNHSKSGVLITFCGLDGSGKTTQINMLQEYLMKKSLPVCLTKQPTDFVRSSQIFRNFMDETKHDAFDYRALALLCASDRVQHTNKTILPKLEHGDFVLSDRYFYCGIANLKARGFRNDNWIYEIAEFIIKPDLSFFIDVPADVAITRVHSRVQEKDRFIDEEFQYRLREEYLNIAKNCGGIVLNCEENPIQTFSYIKSEIEKILEKRGNSERKDLF